MHTAHRKQCMKGGAHQVVVTHKGKKFISSEQDLEPTIEMRSCYLNLHIEFIWIQYLLLSSILDGQVREMDKLDHDPIIAVVWSCSVLVYSDALKSRGKRPVGDFLHSVVCLFWDVGLRAQKRLSLRQRLQML